MLEENSTTPMRLILQRLGARPGRQVPTAISFQRVKILARWSNRSLHFLTGQDSALGRQTVDHLRQALA